MKPTVWRAAIISGAAVLLALGLFALGANPLAWILNDEEIGVAVADAKLESRPIVWRISGELQPAAEVDVVPRISGRLTEVKFKIGDTVTVGAIVASVFSSDLAERVRLVETELDAIRKQLQDSEQHAANTEKQLSRYQELYRQDLIARRDVEQSEVQAATARAQLDLLRAQISQQEAMLAQARKLQQFAHVVAPVSGLVTEALSAGVPVNEGRAILSIAEVNTLKLTGDLPARYANLVQDGMAAKVVVRRGSVAVRVGKVFRVEGNIKKPAVEMPIEIRVENRDRALEIGAPVEVTLSMAAQEQVITIPRSALQSAAGKYYVYRVIDGRAMRRPVELDEAASAAGDPVVIRMGLKANDLVILGRLAKITEGTRVRPAASAPLS